MAKREEVNSLDRGRGAGGYRRKPGFDNHVDTLGPAFSEVHLLWKLQ